MARITVKVHPRAKRSRVTGKLGEVYKVDLAAPPVDGKANEACVRLLAEVTGVPASRVRIVTGQTSRTKVVEIDGIAQESIESKLLA